MVYWGRIVESLQCLAEETGPYALRDHCRAWCWSVMGSQSQIYPAVTQRIESLRGVRLVAQTREETTILT